MYPIHSNSTGSFQEIARRSQGIEFGQLSILTINPSCVRGGHFHKRKEEWFLPLSGKGKLRLIDLNSGVEKFIKIDDSVRKFHHVPSGFVHWVINYSKEELFVLIMISEEYDEKDPDTFIFNEDDK